MKRIPLLVLLTLALAVVGCGRHASPRVNTPIRSSPVSGEKPPLVFGDASDEFPGRVHHITPADLPPPYQTKAAVNGPTVVPRPPDATLMVPSGFHVQVFATGFSTCRLIRTAPNGDVFVVNSGNGRVDLLRGIKADGSVGEVHHFIEGLGTRNPTTGETSHIFGLSFYPPGPDPQFVYVADTHSVVRIPYKNGDVKARGAPQTVVPNLPDTGGHWTRDVVFSNDGQTMFVSVGSQSNDAEGRNSEIDEFHRADILAFKPDGSGLHVYASGIRNAVGLAVHPTTGELWCSTNERDNLGDNLPCDYITHVQPGGFYGWPWFYIGNHPDPRHPHQHTELADRVIVPDVLLQPHNASLEMTFATGKQFPQHYQGGIFAAEHGSWNRSVRTGYEIIYVPLDEKGRARGGYEDFVSGFVNADGNVWGRPVGVTVAADGSLLFSDDGSNTIWRVSWTGTR